MKIEGFLLIFHQIHAVISEVYSRLLHVFCINLKRKTSFFNGGFLLFFGAMTLFYVNFSFLITIVVVVVAVFFLILRH